MKCYKILSLKNLTLYKNVDKLLHACIKLYYYIKYIEMNGSRPLDPSHPNIETNIQSKVTSSQIWLELSQQRPLTICMPKKY